MQWRIVATQYQDGQQEDTVILSYEDSNGSNQESFAMQIEDRMCGLEENDQAKITATRVDWTNNDLEYSAIDFLDDDSGPDIVQNDTTCYVLGSSEEMPESWATMQGVEQFLQDSIG